MAKTEEEKWWEAFGYMSPEDQQATMAEMGYSPSGQMQSPGFEYYGSGLDDYPLEGIAAMPEFTTKGALDPRDLSQVAKGINVAQDYGSLMVDNALTGLAGPGSYDIGAFTPEVEYGKEIRRPGSERLQRDATRGGYEGFLANELLNGATDSEAMATLQKFIEDGRAAQESGELTGDALGKFESVINTVPKRIGSDLSSEQEREKDVLGFWADFDYDKVAERTRAYSDELFKDPLGWEDPETGRFYDKEPETLKTPQMEFFDKYGLPYPTASYEDPKYLQAMLDAEEGTTPEYRQQEADQYLKDYGGVVKANDEAQAVFQGQGKMEDELLKAWEDAQPKALETRPGMATVPGAAGIEYGQERRPSPNAPGAATLMPTAEQMTVPTSVMQPGRRELANPQWGTNPATGIGAGKTWAYTNPQGEMFATPPDQPLGNPRMRTLANGMMGLVDPGTARTGSWNQAFTYGGEAEDPLFSAFRNPEGSKTKALTAKDVSRESREKRSSERYKKSDEAWRAKQASEAADPRLNDIKAAAQMYYMTKLGRSPYADAMAQRRLGASRLGL